MTDTVILPWEREDSDTPRSDKILRDYFDKEAIRADDFEMDLHRPMQQLERELVGSERDRAALHRACEGYRKIVDQSPSPEESAILDVLNAALYPESGCKLDDPLLAARTIAAEYIRFAEDAMRWRLYQSHRAQADAEPRTSASSPLDAQFKESK